MGKGLNDLDLKDEKLPTQDLDHLPEFGGWAPPPQPGAYRLKLPDMTKIYEVFDVNGKGQRVRLVFDRDTPLIITQSPGGKVNGEPFQTRITNAERPRGRKGEEIEVSDGDYLLKALGVKERPTSNRQFIELMKQQSGKEFGADITYSWVCSDQRNIRVDNPEGGVTEVENQKGCGAKFYMAGKTNKPEQKIERGPDGNWPYEIQCTGCGAVLRAFANVDQIRA
jgi:hypothetical protein